MRVAEGVSNQWTGSPLECGTGMWDWNVGLDFQLEHRTALYLIYTIIEVHGIYMYILWRQTFD